MQVFHTRTGWVIQIFVATDFAIASGLCDDRLMPQCKFPSAIQKRQQTMVPSKITMRRVVVRLTVILLGVAAYFLSSGPVILMLNRTQINSRLIELVYAPAMWIGDREPLRQPFRAYLGYFDEINNDWDMPPLVLEPAPTEFADLPNEVVIDGKKVKLEAFLNRDFMPECPPNGRRMGASFKVTTRDGSYFPAGVRAEKVLVLHDKAAWIPKIEEPNRPTIPNDKMCLLVRARGGPRWEPGISVIVLIELRDKEGTMHRLRANTKVRNTS